MVDIWDLITSFFYSLEEENVQGDWQIVMLGGLLFWKWELWFDPILLWVLAMNELRRLLWTWCVYSHPADSRMCCYTLFYSWQTTSGLFNWWWLFSFGVVELVPDLRGEPAFNAAICKACASMEGHVCGMDSVLYHPPLFNLLPFMEDWAEHRSSIWVLEAIYLGIILFCSEFWNLSHCGFCLSNGLRWQTDWRGNLQRGTTLFLVPLGRIQWKRWGFQGLQTSEEWLQKSAKGRLVQKFLIPLYSLWS